MAYQGSKQSINQASKKTDFTADLIWWDSLRLAQLFFKSLTVNNLKILPFKSTSIPVPKIMGYLWGAVCVKIQ